MSGNGAYPGGPGGPAAPGAPEPRSVIDPAAPAPSRRQRSAERPAAPGGRTVADGVPAFAASVVAATPRPGAVGAPASVRPSAPLSPAPAAQNPLGPAFAGAPASTGARLVAFTLDAILIGVGVAAVFIGARSLVLAAVMALQLVIGFCVALARTGATPGNLMLRLRASRGDAPFSPGTGRAFVRAMVTGFGVVVGIGSWIVVASSAWDAGGRRRSWADRAAGTVVVAVPRRGAVVAQAAATVAPPLVFNTSARPAVDDDETPGAPALGIIASAPGLAPAAGAPQAPAVSMPVAPMPAAPVVPSAAAPSGVQPAALLLIFDTGQRVRIELPAAVNLGRRPAPTEPGDLVVAVEDPDSTVSKTHLRLEHSRGRTWATDLGSTNGSGVFADDGRRTELAPGARTLLDDGDRVRIGDRTFTVNELLQEPSPDGGERGASA